MKTSLLERRIFGIRLKFILLVVLFYFLLALTYHITLWINGKSWQDDPGPIFTWTSFMDSSGLGYLIKLLLTIPIWWLIFRGLRHWRLSYRLSVHLITLPLFCYLFQQSLYAASRYFDFGYLQGPGQIWDIYIPGLFYFIQFGIFHGYEYYHRNQENLKLKAELSQAALKSELSALKAQLNPHFLYNVFNTISASLPPEQEVTREMIAKLSDLFRYQLKASKSETVNLSEELAFVQNYIDLEKARFGNRLRVEIDVEESLLDEQVPPMIIQPIVENAIKHGISSAVDGGDVRLKIHRRDGQIHFEIADTGVGVADTSSVMNKGVGLTNTQLRLQKLYGSSLNIFNNTPRGLVVQFSI